MHPDPAALTTVEDCDAEIGRLVTEIHRAEAMELAAQNAWARGQWDVIEELTVIREHLTLLHNMRNAAAQRRQEIGWQKYHAANKAARRIQIREVVGS